MTIIGSDQARQKLQNSKGYAKSPEFSPALGLIIFGEKSVATNLRYIRSLVRSITFFFFDDNYIYVTVPGKRDHLGNFFKIELLLQQERVGFELQNALHI